MTPSPLIDRGNPVLAAMTWVVNLLAAGKTPTAITDFNHFIHERIFCGPQEGGLPPSHCGWRLRHWTAKCVVKAPAETASKLSSLQFGFGVMGGAEATLHGANNILESSIRLGQINRRNHNT